jgi:actin-related protein
MSQGCVVIDTGGLYTRMGIGGEDTPNTIYKTVINGETNEVGSESNTRNDTKPISEGSITDFDAAKRVWEYGLSLVDASDRNTEFKSVVLSVKPHTTVDEQQITMEYFIEELE